MAPVWPACEAIDEGFMGRSRQPISHVCRDTTFRAPQMDAPRVQALRQTWAPSLLQSLNMLPSANWPALCCHRLQGHGAGSLRGRAFIPDDGRSRQGVDVAGEL